MKIILWINLACCMAFASCSGKEEKKDTPATAEKNSSEPIPKPNYSFFTETLVGNWKNQEGDFVVTESWKKLNDSTLAGTSFVIEKGDTTFREVLRIEERGVTDTVTSIGETGITKTELVKSRTLFYIPTVSDQNEGKPVEFRLDEVLKNEYVTFVNPEHDFPTKIKYQFINKNSLIAEIMGIRNGKEARETFPYKRAE